MWLQLRRPCDGNRPSSTMNQPIRKSSISLNSIAISKLWLVYSALSYFRSYILRVLRNGLDSRIIFYLFLFYLLLFLFNSSATRATFIRVKLDFDILEVKDIPRRVFKPFIRTLFGKIIHFNGPLKLCNLFISFREPIYFSKQNTFFIEIFEKTGNNLKI